MTFDRPFVLVALVAVPLLVVLWLSQERRRASEASAFSNPALLPNLIAANPGRRRLVPLGLLGVALIALIVGAAKPRAHVSVRRKEATVVIAIDVSRSMTATDVRPSRLGAARAAAEALLLKVPKTYSIAVVGFGSRAYVAVPPTTDRALARDALTGLTPGEGTALGDAIVLSARLGMQQRAADGTVPPTSVLLISDGARDGGQTTPIAAARRARTLHVPVSTVLIGTGQGIVTQHLTGGYTEQIRVPPNPGALTQIARITGGEFFHARTTAALTSVYRKLGTRVGHKDENRQVADVFGGGAILFLLLGGGLSALWFRRVA
jgi:Ca-activated chloride channel homolog